MKTGLRSVTFPSSRDREQRLRGAEVGKVSVVSVSVRVRAEVCFFLFKSNLKTKAQKKKKTNGPQRTEWLPDCHLLGDGKKPDWSML